MAGHEPEKNEITSPTERLHNDIKDAIKRNQTTKETKEEKTVLTNYLNVLQNVTQMIKNVKRSVLKNIRNVK